MAGCASPRLHLIVPRGLKFSIGVPEAGARGWVLEVFGRRLRLPERGLVGSNGLADARHFLAPRASFEDRACPAGFDNVIKLGGRLYAAKQEHSPFDVVAWHGNHAAFTYDLSLFSSMGSVRVDHPDPSILTVLTAPLDDHGRAIADFVVFPGRWEVTEHSFRPPFMHRNAASEVNMVVQTPSPEGGYDPAAPSSRRCSRRTACRPRLTTMCWACRTMCRSSATLAGRTLWVMFESALPFRATAWAKETPLVDDTFLAHFAGMKSRFDPKRP